MRGKRLHDFPQQRRFLKCPAVPEKAHEAGIPEDAAPVLTDEHPERVMERHSESPGPVNCAGRRTEPRHPSLEAPEDSDLSLASSSSASAFPCSAARKNHFAASSLSFFTP